MPHSDNRPPTRVALDEVVVMLVVIVVGVVVIGVGFGLHGVVGCLDTPLIQQTRH